MHTIQIEKKIDVKRKINPMYLEGEGNCPPEDVGGTHGFGELLEINKELANLDQYIREIENPQD